MNATLLIFALFVLQIFIDAKEDTMNKLKKDLHVIQSIHLSLWLILVSFSITGIVELNILNPSIHDKFKMLIVVLSCYVMLRIALFDVIWNKLNNMPVNYYGKVGLYAKTLNKLHNLISGFDYLYIGVRIFCFCLAPYYMENMFVIIY